MKRIFVIIGIVLMAGVLVLCASPKKKTNSRKIVKKTTKGKVSKPEKDVMLIEFRLECQGVGRNVREGAVMSAKQSKYGDYFYYRGYGENEGVSYEFEKGCCSELLKELSRISKNEKLFDYMFTKLDDEDLTRPRWLLTMKTVDGNEYSIVEYSDATKLRNLVEAAFNPVLEKIYSNELKGRHSRYHYKSDGSLNYRVDYEADGVVHGGYNPEDPYLTF